MKALGKYLPNNELIVNISKLSSGVAISQLIGVLTNIVLAKLYTPHQFAELSIFYSIVSIGLIFVNLRYDLAITQMTSDMEARRGLVLNLVIVTLITSILYVAFHIFQSYNTYYKISIDLDKLTLPICLTIFFGGLSQALGYYNNRLKKFGISAKSGIFKSIFNSISAIGLGYNSESNGLIIAQVIGNFFSFLAYLKRDFLTKLFITRVRLGDVFKLLTRYKEYPKNMLIGSLLDTIAVQLPFFYILKYYGNTDLGYYSFAYRVIALPFTFFIGSLAQVFIQEFTEKKKESIDMYSLTLSRFKKIAVVVSIISFLVLLIGPFLFNVFFGSKWEKSAQILPYIILPLSIRFIVSPLSSLLVLKGYTRYALVWQVIYFFIILVAFSCCNFLSFHSFLKLIILLDLALYLIYFCIILYASKLNVK